jgi:hypothetical protein
MDRLSKIRADELIQRMRSEFEKTMAEVAQAVNTAPDGHLIDGSEERCRDVLGEFRRAAYEAALQMRVEATEADPSFSPSGLRSSRPGQPDSAEQLRADTTASPSLPESGGRNARTGG